MKDEQLLKEIKEELDKLDNTEEKIEFLRAKIRADYGISYELKASVYELLGRLYQISGKPEAELYKKAASAWEMASVFEEEESKLNQQKKGLLKKALKNYKSASNIYRKSEEHGLEQETKAKTFDIKTQLRSYGGPAKNIGILGVMAVFILSFLFLAPTFTGLAITPLENSETSLVGFTLVILGVIGTTFILWRWR